MRQSGERSATDFKADVQRKNTHFTIAAITNVTTTRAIRVIWFVRARPTDGN